MRDSEEKVIAYQRVLLGVVGVCIRGVVVTVGAIAAGATATGAASTATITTAESEVTTTQAATFVDLLGDALGQIGFEFLGVFFRDAIIGDGLIDAGFGGFHQRINDSLRIDVVGFGDFGQGHAITQALDQRISFHADQFRQRFQAFAAESAGATSTATIAQVGFAIQQGIETFFQGSGLLVQALGGVGDELGFDGFNIAAVGLDDAGEGRAVFLQRFADFLNAQASGFADDIDDATVTRADSYAGFRVPVRRRRPRRWPRLSEQRLKLRVFSSYG